MGGKRKAPKNGQQSNAPGSEGAAKAWNDAAAQVSAKPAVQTRLDLGDETVEFQQLEFEVGLSITEAQLKDHDASSKLAEAGRRQKDLDTLINEQVKPAKAKIADLEKEAAQLARESQDMKHKVIRRTEVVYRPNTLSVHFYEPGSDRKIVVMQERRMTEAEIKSFEAGGKPSDEDDIPEHVAPDEEPESYQDAVPGELG